MILHDSEGRAAGATGARPSLQAERTATTATANILFFISLTPFVLVPPCLSI